MIDSTFPLKEENAGRSCIIVLDFHNSVPALVGKIFRLLASGSTEEASGMDGAGATISRLNEVLLASTSSDKPDWHSTSQYSDVSASLKPVAMSFLKQEFSNSSLFVLDEPRFRRTAAFWLDVLASIGVSPVVLFVVPSNSAEPLPDGQFFWLRHILDAEAVSRDMPRIFFTVDDIKDGWRRIAPQIAQLSGAEWPCQRERVGTVIDELISRELPPLRSAPEDQRKSPPVSKWVREINEILRSWASDGESNADYGRIDHIRTGLLNEAAILLGPLAPSGADAKQIDALRRETAEVREKIAHLVAELELYKTRSQEQLHEIVALTNMVRAKESAWESRLVNMLLQLPVWRLLPGALRIHQKMALIRRSGEFDAAWYTKRYKDVAGSKMDPLYHFVRHGMREGRRPNGGTSRQGCRKDFAG